MDRIEQAIEQLKNGGLVIVADDQTREAEGDLIGIAELVTADTVNFMTKYGRGLICAPLLETSAKRLGLTEMTQQNTDAFGTAFTISVDHHTTSTGISAFDRAETIKQLANPESISDDFYHPGHMFPLIARSGGVLERKGHTEAAIDLAQLAGYQSAYICEILNEDGTMARLVQLKELAKKWHLPLLTIDELVSYLLIKQSVEVMLPTRYGNFTLTLFENPSEKETLFLSKGKLNEMEQPLLVRLHSECLTGDVFGSERCDCGEQLHQSMRKIEKEGAGALLYLRQEGRGIGLKNKLKAYQLQEHGHDTYEANLELGFAPDERDYTLAAEILKAKGISQIRLMTNNPEKVKEMEQHGIEVVERIPIETRPLKANQAYLKTKKEKFHHYLSV